MSEGSNKHVPKSLSNYTANALAKNRIEKKKLKDKVSYFQKEYKFAAKNIGEKIIFTKGIKENIVNSTGILFPKRGFSAVSLKSTSTYQSVDKEANRIESNSNERSLSAFVTYTNSESSPKKNLNRSLKEIAKVNRYDFSEEELMKQRHIERLKKKARASNSAMKPIISIDEENRSKNSMPVSFMQIRDKNMNDWNKFMARNKVMRGEVDVKQFTFDDRVTYTIYLNLVDEKDSVPRHPEKQIELLKRSDPVFYKRYKHFSFAKMCNKAPQFDSSDHRMPPLIKYTLEKVKQSMIRENNICFEPVKPYKIEMDNINQRTKEFLKSF